MIFENIALNNNNNKDYSNNDDGIITYRLVTLLCIEQITANTNTNIKG